MKKLKTTERNEIKIEKNGGGFKFEFNTGFYEIFRSELEKFFSLLEYPYKCIRIPVTYKKRNITENIGKIYDNIGHLYNVNLYHNQSSSLVNGKKPALFAQTHLLRIFESMKHALAKSNISVEEINRKLKTILLQCRNIGTDQNDCPTHASDTQDKFCLKRISEIPENEQFSTGTIINLDGSRTGTETNSYKLESKSEQIIDSIVPDRPIPNDRVSKTNISLDVIFQEIQVVKGILLNHMHSTSEAFAGIRDEIVGINNVCKIRSQAVESKIENITESTVALKKELSNMSTTLKSRLQSITDRIGSSQLKKDNDNKTSRSNSGTMSYKTSTSTNNVNESVHVDSLRAEKPMPNKSSDHNRSKPRESC